MSLRTPLLITLLLLPLAACEVVTPGEKEPIKIGYIGPQTGDAAGLGTDMIHAVTLRVQELNSAGGIDGRSIQLIAEDGRCAGAESASAAQKLVQVDKVSAIIGGFCSSETLAAAPITETAKIILFSPVSSSPDVTTAGDFVFRNYPSDDLKGKAFADLFVEKNWKKIAFITENTDFCQGIVRSVQRYIPEDTTIVFNEAVEPGTKDYRTLLTRLKDVDFDIFMVNVQSDVTGAALLAQFRELGFTQVALGTDTTDSAALFELASGALKDFFVISVPPFPETSSLATAFRAAYGEPQWGMSFVGHAYDTVSLIAQAMNAVGTDGTAMRDYLYQLPAYNGEVGTYRFDQNGDVVGLSFALKEFKDGKISTVQEIPLN